MKIRFFDREHIFTPIAIEYLKLNVTDTRFRIVRVIYIFGIRFAVFVCKPN